MRWVIPGSRWQRHWRTRSPRQLFDSRHSPISRTFPACPTRDSNTESDSTNLPAPSRQKAMDWSLVLASQEIPHFIASPDDAGQWSLRIASADVSRASKSIRQYEAENRTRPWQQPYLEGRLVFDWVALVWAAARL